MTEQCLNLERIPQKRIECFRQLFDHLAWIKHQFLRGIRDSRKAGSLWGMMKGVGEVRKSIHQSWLVQGLGLVLLCWGFKGVQEEIPREEASTLQISRLYNAKSSWYLYIWYIWIRSVGFYGISIIDYIMPNPFYTYIPNISNLVWFGLVLWHIKYCRLFNAKSSLYIYIKDIGFSSVVFYGISTLVGHLTLNPLNTYILNI